jgi:hypothetical protein
MSAGISPGRYVYSRKGTMNGTDYKGILEAVGFVPENDVQATQVYEAMTLVSIRTSFEIFEETKVKERLIKKLCEPLIINSGNTQFEGNG